MKVSISISNISKALLEAQKTMGDVTKSSRNPFFKSSYADLNSIRETVIPALNAQGISVLQPTTTLNDKNYVETILLHESGEYISGYTEIKNTDGKPQSEGSGISYARRYGLQSMLSVGAVDDDGEAAQGRAIVKKETVSESNTQAKPATISQVPENKPSQPSTKAKRVELRQNLIRMGFEALKDKGAITKDEFTKKYLNGLPKVTDLDETSLNNCYESMKTDFPELIK